jgi:hypothetical protein
MAPILAQRKLRALYNRDARRRTPSVIAAGSGNENDNRIVFAPLPS